jgi:L-aspartate oxidase
MTLSHKTYYADYVVVGSGVAGLRAAIELSAAGNVLVLAKSNLSDSATSWAQGGIAVALSDEDQIGLHEQDTINAGDGLCRPESVALLVEEGPKYIIQLIEWGTEFDRAGTKLAFTREAAHSRSRILHANGDSTGREISRALLARAHTIPHLHLRAHAFTTELIVESGRAVGLRFIDETDDSLHEVRAPAVLLATGGLGQIYRETTNPDVATGDGMAIAYEAGAVLSDMEFVQFHPTALAVKGAPRFLLSEALRGEGGVLRNIDLDRFMKRYNEAQELAPRDIVARAIVSEMHRTQSDHVYLDMTKKTEEFLKHRFPLIYSTCATYGLDLGTDMAPVWPHYSAGSVFRGRNRRNRSAWRQSPGQQFPARRLGFRRAFGPGHDQGRSGPRTQQDDFARQPRAETGRKERSGNAGKTAESLFGCPRSKNDSRRNVE